MVPVVCTTSSNLRHECSWAHHHADALPKQASRVVTARALARLVANPGLWCVCIFRETLSGCSRVSGFCCPIMRGGERHLEVEPSVWDAISDDSGDDDPATPGTAKHARSLTMSPADSSVGPLSPEDRLRHVSSGSSFQQDVALARQKMEREIEKLRCVLS